MVVVLRSSRLVIIAEETTFRGLECCPVFFFLFVLHTTFNVFIKLFKQLGAFRTARCKQCSLVQITHRQTCAQISEKPKESRKMCTAHKMCASFFSTTFVMNIFHSDKYVARYSRDMCRNACSCSYKETVFLSDDDRNLNVSRNIVITNIRFNENLLLGYRIVTCS
jgi:hypothetical protein